MFGFLNHKESLTVKTHSNGALRKQDKELGNDIILYTLEWNRNCGLYEVRLWST